MDLCHGGRWGSSQQRDRFLDAPPQQHLRRLLLVQRPALLPRGLQLLDLLQLFSQVPKQLRGSCLFFLTAAERAPLASVVHAKPATPEPAERVLPRDIQLGRGARGRGHVGNLRQQRAHGGFARCQEERWEGVARVMGGRVGWELVGIGVEAVARGMVVRKVVVGFGPGGRGGVECLVIEGVDDVRVIVEGGGTG